ncbi:MAG: hypothetical protein MUF21_12310 [Gemmatimonadaceae bacterium]|nr:hypothetical protein [Gemmatimonadaceae bacterium]
MLESARVARRLVVATLATMLALLVADALPAQAILVAPQGVVLDQRARAGSVELYNPGDRASEITLSTVYGYPVSTPEGEITLSVVDRPDSTHNSAAGFIEAFPRRLVLQPGQRQTVRLLARPPQGLAEGEYWARLVVAAKDAAPRATDSASTGASDVRIGLTLEVRTIIAVNYRTGTLRTGVAVETPAVQLTRDSVIVRVPMTRTGSAAWIGATRVRLETEGPGGESQEQLLQTAVYTTLAPRLAFPRGAMPSGRWRVKVIASSERPDVVQSTYLRAATVTADAPLVLP